MAAAGPLDGRCLCGAVTIRVARVEDARVGACHCRMCQRWTGGAFLSVFVPVAEAAVEGPVARHASSAFGERAFCGTCGSHLWFRGTASGDAPYEFLPGLFDEARDWPLRGEIYADRALACLRLEGDHPRRARADYEAKNLFVEGDDP